MNSWIKVGMALAGLVAGLEPFARPVAAQTRRPAAEYETDETAPSGEAAGAAAGQLRPTNDVRSWRFELNGGGDGLIAAINEAVVFLVTKTTGTNWHVQAYQAGLDLDEGKDYVVKFQLKSPESMTVLLAGQVNEPDWHEIGLHEEIAATKDYKDYEFTFRATNVIKGNNRIGVVLGAGRGIVYLKNLSLAEK